MRILLITILSLAMMPTLGCDNDNSETQLSTDITTGVDCDGGRVIEGSVSNDCWQHPRPPGDFEFQEALDYCINLDLGGHTDWAHPNHYQFLDLLANCDRDLLDTGWGSCDPCADSERCFALFGQDQSRYWIFDYDEDTSAILSYSGTVDFGSGHISFSMDDVTSNKKYAVRCVRKM